MLLSVIKTNKIQIIQITLKKNECKMVLLRCRCLKFHQMKHAYVESALMHYLVLDKFYKNP